MKKFFTEKSFSLAPVLLIIVLGSIINLGVEVIMLDQMCEATKEVK